MNRRELARTLAGMVGSVVGVGCAAPQESNTLPLGLHGRLATAGSATGAAASGLDLVPYVLTLGKRFSSTLVKPAVSLRVTSTAPNICRVQESGNYVVLYALELGACEIHAEDPATGVKAIFHVNVV
jgi:hypothetical protein